MKTRRENTHSPGSHQPFSQNYIYQERWSDIDIRWLNVEQVKYCSPMFTSHTDCPLISNPSLSPQTTRASGAIVWTATSPSQGVWLTPTVHKSKHHIKGGHRGCLQVRRSAGGEGWVAGWQGWRENNQRWKLVGWEKDQVFFFYYLYYWIYTPLLQLKLNCCPSKPNSPNVPDEKWPNKHCCCSLCDKVDKTYSSKDRLSNLWLRLLCWDAASCNFSV